MAKFMDFWLVQTAQHEVKSINGEDVMSQARVARHMSK